MTSAFLDFKGDKSSIRKYGQQYNTWCEGEK